MEPEIGELYRTDKQAFDLIARYVACWNYFYPINTDFYFREWTWKFAMHDVLLNSDVNLRSDRESG